MTQHQEGKQHNLKKKWAKDLNRQFSEKSKEMAHGHEKMLNITSYQRDAN